MGLSFSAGPNQECWHEPTSRMSFPPGQKTYGRDWDLVVTDLADYYHSNHDGWEAQWPLQIRIYEGGAELARFAVERDYEPVFMAFQDAAPDTASPDTQPGTERSGVNQTILPQTEKGS